MFNKKPKSTKKGLLADKKAVSPMIATIMLIAIVAVLGAVIAASSMKTAGNMDTAGTTVTLTAAEQQPGVSPYNILITNAGGDQLTRSQLDFSVTLGQDSPTVFQKYDDVIANGTIATFSGLNSDPFKAGDVGTFLEDTSSSPANLTTNTYPVVVRYQGTKVLLDTNVQNT